MSYHCPKHGYTHDCSVCLTDELRKERDQADTMLATAQKVVEAARRATDPDIGDEQGLVEALSSYDATALAQLATEGEGKCPKTLE